jgi:hypothetical protein
MTDPELGVGVGLVEAVVVGVAALAASFNV